MINTKRPNTNDYTQVGFIEAKDNQGNYQNIDHIYDSEGNIVFQQGYLNEYDGADDFHISAIGKPLIDYTIYGNTFQDGTPTPDSPVMPQGTGERTGNLFDEDYTNISGTIQYRPIYVGSGNFTLSTTIPYDLGVANIFLLSGDVTSGASTPGNGAFFNHDVTAQSVDGYVTIAYRRYSGTTSPVNCDTMLNTGSTALPYEPYGIKIPISSASTTTPVYLGEVETTRKVKKLVLDGNEPWILSGNIIYISNTDTERLSPLICTHFQNVQGTGMWNGNNWVFQVDISNLGMSGRDAWIAYLQQQYAAGTPVTVWYVLATETTGIVNEPLMRIGDYADSVDFSQAGVQIPTLKRPNTTVIDITTSLPPSEVYAKYRGSKTQQYDLFLAANGDSFEAKNGQSLYIGDDT